MPLTREMFQDLLTTYGGGDTKNIFYIVTTQSDAMRLSWYEREGAGWQFVDKDLGNGTYRTGFEFYNKIPPSLEDKLEENGAKSVTFIEIGAIDRIAFKSTTPPSWAWAAPSSDAYLSSITIDGAPVVGFNKEYIMYEYEQPYGTTTVPTVAATADEAHATLTITQADSPTGNATIAVVAQDGTTKKTYTIMFTLAPEFPPLA